MVGYQKLPKRLTKSFKYWEIQDLEETFALQKHSSMSLLKDWLAVKHTISVADKDRLKALRQLAAEKVEYWNEEEMKMRLISPLMELVQFDGKKYSIFYDRPLKDQVDDVEMSGVIDMLVASGYQKPIQPFFFLHEYKQQKRIVTDPFGQLMAAMLVAQAKNTEHKTMPLYGCYIIGRNWFFVALEDRTYGVSSSFDATKETDLETIFMLLLEIKQRIENYLK